jgi:ABC-2 type transport system ATP-binding protein
VFGLLGPNGASKSTTVEILQGNRDRDAGEVSVLGSDPSVGTRAWRSRVGIVRQDESAPAELTVRETVRHFARYYPRPRDPREVIALVGLEAKADSRIKALSGGQRRRLDVALGVIGAPTCCSWTSRRPGSTLRPAGSSGR